jgi:hypothetical protein
VYFKKQANDLGYLHIQGLYDPGYVRWLESLLPAEPNRAVRNLMDSHATVFVARYIIGKELKETGENNYNFEPDPSALYTTPHRDYPFGTCNIWRFAMYFRDYKDTSDGAIAFSPCSHRGIKTGYITIIKPSPGDLVLWNLTTFHQARVSGKLPRNAIFFDYGEGEEVEKYIEWRKEKKK